MYNVRKDLGVDCWLIKILDKLLHLWPRRRCENSVGFSTPKPHYAPDHSHRTTLGFISPPDRHWMAK